MADQEQNSGTYHVELPTDTNDPIIDFCHKVIRLAVRMLALLMVLVILLGIGDVIYVLYQRLLAPPVLLLEISDIFETFAAFLAVLIAIEIFINIRLYLGSAQLPVKLVLATALMAVARKVIVLDFNKLGAMEVFSLAAVVLGLGIAYGLLALNHQPVKLEKKS